MKITKREGAVLSSFTGIMCCKFEHMHEYAEEVLGRPIFRHEFVNSSVIKELKEKAKKEFIEIIKNQEL